MRLRLPKSKLRKRVGELEGELDGALDATQFTSLKDALWKAQIALRGVDDLDERLSGLWASLERHRAAAIGDAEGRLEDVRELRDRLDRLERELGING